MRTIKSCSRPPGSAWAGYSIRQTIPEMSVSPSALRSCSEPSRRSAESEASAAALISTCNGTTSCEQLQLDLVASAR